MADTLSPIIPQEYDYIVVGGGLAGLVVASRLSEDVSKSVLVIEAGANRQGDPRVEIPGLMTTLYDDPESDWMFMSVPQEHVNDRQIACPRGKLLGGSSAINFSYLIYPSRAGFDSWAELGNSGWAADDMLKYFQKFLKYYPPAPELRKRMLMDWIDEGIQGYDGPVPATFTEQVGPFNEAWMKTFQELGYLLPGDPLAGEKIGAFQGNMSIYPNNKARATSASAYYYQNAADRPNLQVLTDSLVEKVLLEKANNGLVTATGVQFVTKTGERNVVHARKEVILACGTIKSPHVLELSGIGNKDLLEKHGIQVLINNPHVGENLQDHPFTSVSFEVADDQVSGDVMRDMSIVQAAMKQYQETNGGPLSGTPLSFAYMPPVDGDGVLGIERTQALLRESLEKVNYAPFPSQEQQYKVLRRQLLNPSDASGEFLFLPLQLNGNAQGATNMTTLFSKTADGNYITLAPMINHPFSRGSVHIASADPAAYPTYDPRYLSHPLDIELLARQLQFCKKIVETEPLASMLKKNGRRIPEDADFSDLEAAKELTRERLFTAFHPAGTCAMLPEEIGGVVDSRLKVYGTTNLRVVDASIFPIEPLGNIQSTVYAVAEKAADIIKEDNQKV